MTTGFKIVSRFDPALDAQAMLADGSMERYRESGEARYIKTVPGKDPAWFYCRRLRTSEMQAVRTHVSEADVYAACFARGVSRATGLRGELPDGADEHDDPPRRDWVHPAEGKRPLSTAELDTFDPGDVFEIGAAIYGRSILGKGRPAAWPQPDTSRLAIQGLVALHVADQRRTAASSDPSKPAPEAQQPTTSTG